MRNLAFIASLFCFSTFANANPVQDLLAAQPASETTEGRELSSRLLLVSGFLGMALAVRRRNQPARQAI
ncbi:MAG: hypothetical protein K2X35_01180 [Bryobacteraceae bacterium]|nr:hypothetical protein [Bryobacteraceae bacterium]